MQIYTKDPWPKISFKQNNREYDGYIYFILGDKFYISQNPRLKTLGCAQNWIIDIHSIIKFYDEKYGFKCTCGELGGVHTLVCKWKTINTDLL